MSPTPAAGFFGGIRGGFAASSGAARSQQAATEKLREHMYKVDKDRVAYKDKVTADTNALITEFQNATPDTMGRIQEKMQNYINNVEDKSILPTGMLDGSYGLPVMEGIAESMVPRIDGTAYDKQGPAQDGGGPTRGANASSNAPAGDPARPPGLPAGPPPAVPSPANPAGLQGPRNTAGGRPLGETDRSSRAYQKLKSKRTRTVAAVAAGGAAPQYVLEGYGSQAAFTRDNFKKDAHFNLLSIVSNGGKNNPAEVLRDPQAWANAKDLFYIQAEQAGMDGKDAKAVVDRFEKDRELAEAGVDTMAERSSKLTSDMHKFLGKWFQIEGGMDQILAKLDDIEGPAYRGALKEGLSAIVAHPEMPTGELMMFLFNVLDKTSQMHKAEAGPDGTAFDFGIAQTRANAGALPIIPAGTPSHGIMAMKNIPGSTYGTTSQNEYLSVTDPQTGETYLIVGPEAIDRAANMNREFNEKHAAKLVAEKQAEDTAEAKVKKAAADKAAAEAAEAKRNSAGEVSRREDVDSLRDSEIVGGIRTGLGAVADLGADAVIGADDLISGAGDLLEEGYEGVKKAGSKVRNVAESIFGGL